MTVSETLTITPDLKSRRSFLKGVLGAGAFTIVGSTSIGSVLGVGPMTAWGLPGAGDDRVIVNIFLRGGADALNIVVPHGDDDYYRIRGSIARQAGDYNDLDGFFGLNTAFSALQPHYEQGRIAFVQAVGSNDPTRSHFVAQPIMDSGFGPGGWLQRALAAENLDSPVSGVTIGSRTSDGLAGPFSGIAVKTIDSYVRDAQSLASARTGLEALYAAAENDLEVGAVLGAFASIDQLAAVNPEPAVDYPGSNSVAKDLSQAAALIKGDIGVRCVAVNFGGWDHHSNEVARMVTTGGKVSEAIDAFWADLGPEHQDRVMIVVNTEFGRTAHQNGSGGTDHGHGGFMMLMGNGLVETGGGQVHLANGRWPGLTDNDLHLERYQPITTDFRSIYAEVADRHMGIADVSSIVPGFAPQYLNLLGADDAVAGDVDGSGVADEDDVRAILDHNVGGDGGDGYNPGAGDVNNDGKTDLLDALIVAQQAANLE